MLWAILFVGLFLGIPLFILLRVSVAASGDGIFVTTTALWLGSVAAIVFVSAVISTVLVIMTFRSSEDRNSKWKAFWNLVDLAWVIVSGLGIFGAISTAGNILMPLIADLYVQDQHEAASEIAAAARLIDGGFCSTAFRDRDICAKVEVISNPAAVEKQPFSPSEFSNEVAQYMSRYHDMPWARDLAAIERQYWDYQELVGFGRRETTTIVSPRWAKWVITILPLIFALAFPARVGRGIAAFKFK